MKENDNYCDFSCDGIKEQQKMLDEIIDFSKYNPEYGLVMVGEIMEMVYYPKDKLTPTPDGHEIIYGD